MNSHLTFRRRPHLRHIASQAQGMLFGLMIVFSIGLFLAQLFLMNKLSMEGYVMTRQLEFKKDLVQESELIEAEIARMQTQDFVSKTTSQYQFIAKDNSRFVYVPLLMTAQK